MVSTVHVGKSRALVFPVMSDGHLKFEFDDSNSITYNSSTITVNSNSLTEASNVSAATATGSITISNYANLPANGVEGYTTAVASSSASFSVSTQPTTSSSTLDTSTTSAAVAMGAITFSTGWNPTPITASTTASNNNAIILRNRQTGSGTTANKTFRFFYIDNSASNGFPADMQGPSARISDIAGINGMTNGGLTADTLIASGYLDNDIFVPEVGLTSSGNNQHFRFMLTQAINSFNGIGSNPSSGLDITASTSNTTGVTGSITLMQDAAGTAGNHNTTPNTGPVIGSTIANSSKLSATVFSGGTNATNATNINEYMTITMRNSSGNLVTKNFKFIPSANGNTNSVGTTANGTSVVRVVIGGNTTATANALRNAINHTNGFNSTVASVSGTTITISSPSLTNFSGQSISRTSAYSSASILGSITGFTGGVLAHDPGSYIQLTDSLGVVKKFSPVKVGDAVSTGDTGTISVSGSPHSVIFFQLGTNNNTTATNLGTAIHGASGFNITRSVSNNIITLTQGTVGTDGNTNIVTQTFGGTSKSDFSGGVNAGANVQNQYISITNSQGGVKKYHAHATESNGATNNTYVWFQNGADNNATAENLKNAIINATNGHGQTLIVSRTNNVLTLTATTQGGNEASSLNNLSGVVLASWSGAGNSSLGSIWNYNRSFTIEALITPYDVNGIGHRTTGQGRLDSTKTPPSPNLGLDNQLDAISNYQSVTFFGANRNTHKMMLFANTYFKFYLQNTTSSNFNQPAEYKLVCEITDSLFTPITHTVASEPVFISKSKLFGYYDPTGFYSGATTSLARISTTASASSSNITVSSGEANAISTGNKIYDSSGVLIGTVSSVSSNTITLSASPATTVTSTIYTSQPKEALYVEQISRVSCVFNGNTVTLYVNGNIVKAARVNIGHFTMHPSDCFIGQDGNLDATNRKQTQFMGELYEISMCKGASTSLSNTSLDPNYAQTLFYYRFGE